MSGLASRYKLRAAVDIADVSEEYAVWASFGWGAERKSAPNT